MIKLVLLMIIIAGSVAQAALILSAILSVICAGCLMVAVFRYEDRLDDAYRFMMCGLAACMLMTFPALFIRGTPFDGWSISASKFFLTGLLLKRYGEPAFWAWMTDRRIAKGQPPQTAEQARKRAFRDVR